MEIMRFPQVKLAVEHLIDGPRYMEDRGYKSAIECTIRNGALVGRLMMAGFVAFKAPCLKAASLERAIWYHRRDTTVSYLATHPYPTY